MGSGASTLPELEGGGRGLFVAGVKVLAGNGRLRHAVLTRSVRAAAPAWRETVVALAALMAVAFEPAAIHLGLCSRDERRQAIDAAVVNGLHRRLRLILRLRLAMFAGVRLVALKGLKFE